MFQNETADSNFNCLLAGRCSGCLSIKQTYVVQIEKKIEHILELFKQNHISTGHLNVSVTSIDQARLRDRVDLTVQATAAGPRLGLYEIDGDAIIDMNECPQMTVALESWFKEFRQNLPVIKIGSVRLRVAPDGTRGVWLDFANVDVKTLLDEKTWLNDLFAQSIVEIGQRRKRLSVKEGALKLTDAIQYPWFETYLGSDEHPCALYSSIAGFSQPGFRTNKSLVSSLRKIITSLGANRWLELFCGNGNFTLPLVSWGKQVTALELDPAATEAIKISLAATPLFAQLKNQPQIIQGDAYRKTTKNEDGLNLSPLDLSEYDALLVDPPRSGLKTVLEWLETTEPQKRPAHIVYVSCFGPTLAQDAGTLNRLGYRIQALHGVDQFAQSPHCEWLAHFEKSEKIL